MRHARLEAGRRLAPGPRAALRFPCRRRRYLRQRTHMPWRTLCAHAHARVARGTVPHAVA
eukprot:scaffold82024_cov63-Phaeocystis_antarctica.AAC.2